MPAFILLLAGGSVVIGEPLVLSEYADGRYLTDLASTGLMHSAELISLMKVFEVLSYEREKLINSLAGSFLQSFPVHGGLSAICLSCVEKFVTPTLVSHGFPTRVVLKAYPRRQAESAPGIHCFNLITFGGRELIVDMDADPLLECRMGVLIMPMAAAIRWYGDGVVMHERTIDTSGRICRFSFWDEETPGSEAFFSGDGANWLSLISYCSGDDDFSPVCLVSGARIFFGLSRFLVAGVRVTKISFTLVCRRTSETQDESFEIQVREVYSVRVSAKQDGSDEVLVRRLREKPLRFVVASTGMLAESESLIFQECAKVLPKTVQCVIGRDTALPIVLPSQGLDE